MKKYIFKPYCKHFPKLFKEEKKRIVSYLKIDAEIEHVGSSSVPGLGGKGIIDIAILTKDKDAVADCLLGLGYDFHLSYSTNDRFFFKMNLPDLQEGERTYHIHVMEKGSEESLDMLFFKEYLQKHPEYAKKYEDIKRKAAEVSHNEGEVYRKLKEPFMKKLLQKRKS
jgi:GrpB-like predicted nucleotidyltransferase (UPF0157 family)